MRMSNINITKNCVNGDGTSCEIPTHGRCAIGEQDRPGHYHATAEQHQHHQEPKTITTKVCLFAKKGKATGKATGKHKDAWTREERKVLWECYVRSGGSKKKGYIKAVKDMWDGKDMSIRSTPSLLAQIGQIRDKGSGLTLVEREEIEKTIRDEWHATLNRLPAGETLSQGDGERRRGEEPDSRGEEENGGEVQPMVISQKDWDEMFGDSDDNPVFEGFEIEESGQDTYRDGDMVREVNEEERKVLHRLREVFGNGQCLSMPSLKTVDRRRVNKESKLVDGLLHNIKLDKTGPTEVNRLYYTGMFVVTERLGLLRQTKRNHTKQNKPWWQRRLESSIVDWRKDLARIDEMKRGVDIRPTIRMRLEGKYKLSERGFTSVRTFLTGKIRAASTKIRWHVEKGNRTRQNNLFQNNQSQLYKELGSKNLGAPKVDASQIPDAAESREFWSNIWSHQQEHNKDAAWLDSVRERLSTVQQQDAVAVQLDDVQAGIRKMANWKAPGPDGVRGFWFKKFLSLQVLLTAALQDCIDKGTVPNWMTEGRTVLIQKDPAKGTVASNYRPIACLPLMWKLLTGIFADKIYSHLLENNILPDEQKGCRKKSRGTKDQLLIDKTILREVRIRKRCLAMGWIDYRKAYDMVPHSWILEMLKLVKVSDNIGRLIENSMVNWSTLLTANGEELGQVRINRGIFQGDSLSPLLFIIIMLPLTIILRREKLGYKMGGQNSQLINHLLFMDDLKLYADTEEHLGDLVRIVETYSTDIGMKFGLDKCAVLTIRKGVRVACEGIRLPGGEIMREVDENGYKYLGVLEGADIMKREMKEKISGEYLRRVKALARSKLYAGNLLRGVNAWALGVVRYSAGILDWKESELKALDRKTRKILASNGVFHQKSSVDRLYLKRKDGGRGLISVTDCVSEEVCSLIAYVKASEEPLLKAVAEELVEGGESKWDYKKRVDAERKARLGEKKLHGKFFRDVKDVADDRSWQWIRGGFMAKSTEAFVFAAQEQALRTRLLQATIERQEVDVNCRVCGKVAETVGHLASGCSCLAQKEYKCRHDRMGLRVYWELCGKFGIARADKWYEERPVRGEVRRSSDKNYEIWWDRPVETANKLDHNRPDVILINRVLKEWIIIDFSVPWDKNVRNKENEKMCAYNPLAREVRRLHNVSTKVIPIVVGALGVVSSRLEGYIKAIGIPDVLGGLQTSAVLGTTNILKKVLSL